VVDEGVWVFVDVDDIVLKVDGVGDEGELLDLGEDVVVEVLVGKVLEVHE
jgi:hypothetical protein